MKLQSVGRVFFCVLTLAVLSTLLYGKTAYPAPAFTARTLDGETFTNASVRGRVVLLQFWATWCPYCRRDQSIVDRLERQYSGDLLVLAVDVGESADTVKGYLREYPRACRIALDENKSMGQRFVKGGLPYYVLLDEAGNIIGTQNGSGGEASLRELLSLAGLSNGSGRARRASQDSTPAHSKTTVISVPGADPPRQSNPKTVFVLASGERIETERYTIESGILHLSVNGQLRSVPLNSLNVNATTLANRERGIQLKLPANRSEVLLSF